MSVPILSCNSIIVNPALALAQHSQCNARPARCLFGKHLDTIDLGPQTWDLSGLTSERDERERVGFKTKQVLCVPARLTIMFVCLQFKLHSTSRAVSVSFKN